MLVPASTIDAVGWVGAILCIAIYIPQVLHSWRTRNAHGMSIYTLLIQCTSCCVWIAYGILIVSTPILTANFFTFLCSTWLVSVKVRYRQRGLNNYIMLEP
jgi:MtN3 and saliva related transmembrane protein